MTEATNGESETGLEGERPAGLGKGTLIEEILSLDERSRAGERDAEAARTDSAPLVGVCVGVDELRDAGYLVRWESKGSVLKGWMSGLRGVDCRVGDRVLLQHPSNALEPLVVGVIGGRPRVEAREPVVTLEAGRNLMVRSASGALLLEIEASEDDTTVRLFGGKPSLQLDEPLEIVAASIDLRARTGEIVIDAPEDVVVRGKTIRLN